MLSWKIGAVTVTRIVEIELPVPYSAARPFLAEATPEALRQIPWLYPNYVTEDGHLRLSIHALLVEAPGVRLVVDTCIGNDRPRSLVGGQALSTDFLARFAEAGWTREVPTFPKARYLIGRQEHAHWSAEGDADQQTILADSIQPVFDAGLVDLVEMDHRISPELRLVPTPGHTPGHVSVAIESEGQRALITGDMVHHPCQLAHPDWSPPFDSDPLASAVMRLGVFSELADQPVLVIGTHFAAPTAGHVKRDGAAFRFDT
jgi:hypothetical protein